MVAISTILVPLNCSRPHHKFQGNRSFCSGEEDFLKVCTIYDLSVNYIRSS